MSIVTRGLSQPEALMPSFGLGLGVSILIVVPLEQYTEAVEVFEEAGIAEHELTVTALDPAESIVVIEYQFDKTVITPIQRSEVVDRFISIEASQPELTVSVAEITQTAELVELLQTAMVIAPEMVIQVIEVTEDVDVNEAINKVQPE